MAVQYSVKLEAGDTPADELLSGSLFVDVGGKETLETDLGLPKRMFGNK